MNGLEEPTLPPDRRGAILNRGLGLARQIETWKAQPGLEDEFRYSLAPELRAFVVGAWDELKLMDEERKLSPQELATAAGVFYRAAEEASKRGFWKLADDAYRKEQYYKRRHFLGKRRWARWLTLLLYEWTTGCGRSLTRWFLSSLGLLMLVAILGEPWLDSSTKSPGVVRALYWSASTLTTLGYGDVLPTNHPWVMALSAVGAVVGLLSIVLLGVMVGDRLRRL